MAEGNDKTRERRINFAALKKQDKHAEGILDTASSVAHYKFDATTEKWEKTEFEGSLFVYKRNEDGITVAMMIMNRLKKENLLTIIGTGMEFRQQEPFLLCRTAKDIIGIWFYDATECARISALLTRIAELAGDKEQLKIEIDEALAEVEKAEPPKVDVMQLFAKAKEDFDQRHHKKDGITKSVSMTKFVPSEQNRPTILKRTNSFPESINEVVPDNSDDAGISMNMKGKKSQDSDTLMRLLQGTKRQARKSRSRTLSYGEQVDTENKMLAEQLKKYPGDLAVHREDSAPKQKERTFPPKTNVIDVAMLEANVLGNLGGNTDSQEAENARDVVPNAKNPGNDVENSPMNRTPTKIKGTRQSVGRGLLTQLADSPSGSTARRELMLGSKFPEPPPSGLVGSLMSPMQFKAGLKAVSSQDISNIGEVSQLNKQQFRDAFIDLLQNDNTFLEKLHNSYLSMASKTPR
ncbi:uncharacterized protein LOC135692708 [Rhopilema esculentum]|uniref:uncharacterized protein LOC135692708 n=1 Tax=Rhopilema esculentum TaxID=499914 RepID=UPI0031E1CB17